jgi:predicted AAA+ superfamily ATPase
MIERVHLQQVKKRVQEPRRFIQVITGPRQVGKTTLVRQLAAQIKLDSLFLSADGQDALGQGWLASQWEAARLKMDQSGNAFLLIIDEIQKIDHWCEQVKTLWDEDTHAERDLRVLLLGSSRLLMQRGLTESLAGRFELTQMGHWSLTEMQQAFGWLPEQYAWFGGYPGSASLIGDEVRWKDYIRHALIEPAISRDILMMTRVDKPALLKKLFELGCLYSGQILSYTKLIGQLQDAGNTTTLSHYLSLLDTSGLLGGLEKFAGDVIRKRSSSPKFQVDNTALISGQSDQRFDQIKQDPKAWGRVVESAVGAHLINASNEGYFSLYYWREGDHEVDFVLEKAGRLLAIEVKSGAVKNQSGLSTFIKKFNPGKTLLISPEGLSWQEFLLIPPAQLV